MMQRPGPEGTRVRESEARALTPYGRWRGPRAPGQLAAWPMYTLGGKRQRITALDRHFCRQEHQIGTMIRLQRAMRVVLSAQAAGMLAAILLSAPSFIDRLVRPTICTDCFDFRGLSFVLFAFVFLPPSAVLVAAAWLLPRKPTVIVLIALAIDLAIIGLMGYAVLENAAQPGTNVDAPPFPLDIVQNALIAIPTLIGFGLGMVSLSRMQRSVGAPLQLLSSSLVVQLLAMLACISLTTPRLSDRLSSGYAPAHEGMSFVAWTVFLAPAVVVLALSAWRINLGQRAWLLVAGAVDVMLLCALALFAVLGYPGPPEAQADALPPVFSAAQLVLVALPAAVTLVLTLRSWWRGRRPA